jgi:transcriptional regulator with XRE-family HTH domain
MLIARYSADSVADQTGLNRAHLSRLENGKQNMMLRTLKLIADTLGVRVVELVRGF